MYSSADSLTMIDSIIEKERKKKTILEFENQTQLLKTPGGCMNL